MKQRTTYIVSDTSATHPDNFAILPTSLQIKFLRAAREDRLVLGYDELPTEIQSVLKQCNQVLIRWSTGRPYASVDPYAARVPAGLHVHLRPQRDVVPSICGLVNTAFGSDNCGGFAESFIPISGIENAYQFYTPLKSISALAAFVDEHVCTGEKEKNCATSVKSVDYLDLKWDIISQMLVVNLYWSRPDEPRRETVAADGREQRNIEVGVLGNDKPMAQESLTLGGVLHVVGRDDKLEPVMFTFPARHHSYPASYNLTTSKPPGLHPKLQLSIAPAQSLKEPDNECTLNAYFTLPRGLFIDEYQLSPTNPQLLESLNIKRILGISGKTDLEAPVWASKRWGSAVLVEVDSARSSGGLDVELPLHLRYLEPEHNTTSSEVSFAMPAVFWACRSEEWSKMGSSPFDRLHLGWEHLFPEQTMYYHLSPSEDAWKSVPVPVLNLQHAVLLKVGTVVAILGGFLWVVWKICAAYVGERKADEKETQPTMADTTTEGRLALRFAALGLSEKALKEATRNKKITTTWMEVLEEAGISDDHPTISDLKVGTALASLVSFTAKGDGALGGKRRYIAKATVDGRIKTNVQVDAAVKFVKASPAGTEVDEKAFDRECGVGIEFTPKTLKAAVAKYIEKNRAAIEEHRYKKLTAMLADAKTSTDLKWAAPGDLKKEFDAQYLALLGPKDERDASPKKQKKVPAEAKTEEKKVEEVASDRMFTEGFLAQLHKPGGNEQIIPKRMTEHLKATGGKVFTRFPPEPNGYLHIGHSKAIAINFGFARYHGGECYLRYDDTNPESEEERYIVAIREIIEWLGFKPYKITHASDHFDKLYELAKDLIKRDKGYVCHCTAEEVNAQRGGKDNRGPRFECKHRNRPVEESLAEFEAMRDGKYKPKEAMMRMKMDILGSGNPQMWDLTAYRILDAPHPQTGNKWKIYPTYDFTHCLCDSFENISHSLCTTEFINSRESYDWLCNALEIYRPQQREYGRLNLTGTIMSKRKIMKLVDGGHVRGWDDPRLYTLVAIRRRGIPPGAILAFVNELGVTTSHTNIQIKRFEQTVRRYLEETVPRLMMILDPLEVVIENYPREQIEEFDSPFKPNDPKMGTHNLPFSRVIYIDRSDFRETASKDYFRLAPGQPVGLLRVPHPIRYVKCEKDPGGKILQVVCRYENDVPFKKPKTYIQWIADAPKKGSPVRAEIRVTNQLFKSENPNDNPDGFLADINPDSEEVFKYAFIETGFHEIRRRAPWPEQEGEKDKSKIGPESVRFQALRVGYFAMDKDTTGDKVVLNRIVSLKEDSGKNA